MHRSPFPRLTDASLSVDGAAAAPAPKRPAVQMPDEYLPPNKILFLQNLPESVTKDQLMALFSQLAFYPHSPPCLLNVHHQISKPARSPAHSNKAGHRVRGVFGRGERRGCQGCSAQLQARRREQDQGMHLISSRFGLVLIRSTDHLCTQVIVYCMIGVSFSVIRHNLSVIGFLA